jgi:hypothetical protein
LGKGEIDANEANQVAFAVPDGGEAAHEAPEVVRVGPGADGDRTGSGGLERIWRRIDVEVANADGAGGGILILNVVSAVNREAKAFRRGDEHVGVIDLRHEPAQLQQGFAGPAIVRIACLLRPGDR